MTKKLDIQEMRKIAETRGGLCISDNCVNNGTKLRWRCKNNHEWEATPRDIKRRHWCPVCARTIPLTIEEMRKLASSRGGKCLSDAYVNARTKLHWRCKEGHDWEAVPDKVKGGRWCPFCARNVPLTIEEMREIAASRGGECLSETYVNMGAKLHWRCGKGHEWNALPSSIKRGSWCPHCTGNARLTIEEIRELAASKGGVCLSGRYVNNSTKLRLRCKEGHEWEATPGHIKNGGRWCPYCAHSVPLTVEEMREIAKSRNGVCLSETYINSNTNLRWRCKEGHEWAATPSNIKRGTWCPDCALGVSERICRGLFEHMFEEKFPKTKPAWLVNSRGRKMELDGYSEKLGIAFEYQGEQHYGSIAFFSRKRDYAQQSLDDKLKARLCEEQGVKLLTIPYTIAHEDKAKYILKRCNEEGIRVPNPQKRVDFLSLGVYSSDLLEEMRELARSRKGDCLSKTYVNANTHLRWRCEKGHEWNAISNSIQRGSWCKECAGLKKGTIEEMRKIAASKGGECLSETYTNNYTKLRWRCKEGHGWNARPGDIKRGNWCPHCAVRASAIKRSLDIEEMQEIAKSRDGVCLSETYTNSNTKLRWRCEKGHKWEATPGHIKNGGRWCPFCARNVPLTIEEMRKLASSRGGECLSETYVNSQTKLHWRCKDWHEWATTPSNIKSGKWCPKCSKKITASKLKSTIGAMREIAKSRNGACISEIYTNNNTKLRWRCKEGHEWAATPGNIKSGKWCPICARVKTRKKAQK